MKLSMRRDQRETAPTGDPTAEYGHDAVPVDNPHKGRWERSWPTIACGAGMLFRLLS